MQSVYVRSRLSFLALALLAALLPLAPVDAAHNPTRTFNGYIPVAVGTLDETVLHYQVQLPDASKFGPGPYPLVVDYSGYEPGITIYDSLHHHFGRLGYAVAGVNIRGTGCSGGRFDYFEPRQAVDGKEAIEWLTSQSWSNGRAAMVGKSYPGITPLFVAAQQPKGLVAIVPGHAFGDLYRDVPYPGGIMNVTFAGGWSAGRIYDQAAFIPTKEAYRSDQRCMQSQAEHAPNPPFNPFVRAIQPQNQFDSALYKERSPWYFADKIAVPTMLVQSYQDEQVGARAIEVAERFRPGLAWRLVATNGDHAEYYRAHVFSHITRFLDYHLRQVVPANDPHAGLPYAEALAAYVGEPKVDVLFENNRAAARFGAKLDTWPPTEQEVWRLGLTPSSGLVPVPSPNANAKGRGKAVGLGQHGPAAGSVSYTYLPGEGSQSRGGYRLRREVPVEGSWNDRPAPGTSASFTTAPLEADRVLFGTASLDLWVSSTAPDTDFEVTLSEVRPDGQEMFVQQGWLRASHRKLDETLSTALRPYQTHLAVDAQPLVPGVPTPVRIEVFPFGHTFRAGSQVRVTVAAPHVTPDLWGFAALPGPAVNTIHTGPEYPSSVALPLITAPVEIAPGLPPCPLSNQPCRPEPAPEPSPLP